MFVMFLLGHPYDKRPLQNIIGCMLKRYTLTVVVVSRHCSETSQGRGHKGYDKYEQCVKYWISSTELQELSPSFQKDYFLVISRFFFSISISLSVAGFWAGSRALLELYICLRISYVNRDTVHQNGWLHYLCLGTWPADGNSVGERVSGPGACWNSTMWQGRVAVKGLGGEGKMLKFKIVIFSTMKF